MSDINFLGSYSGIDSTAIEKLMAVEKRPLIQMQENKQKYEEEKNAWRDVNTRLSSLLDTFSKLKDSDTFNSKEVILPSNASIKLSAGTSAVEGTYEIYVEKLATNTRVFSAKIALAEHDNEKSLGLSGQFTITNNDNYDITINIEVDDSLHSIIDKINVQTGSSDIQASIVDSRIVIKDSNYGDRAVLFSDDGSGLVDSLGFSATDKTEELGQNSLFYIDGIKVERAENQIDDVIDAMTITLEKTHDLGESDKIIVSKDTSKATDAVNSFIKQFNSTFSFINEKLTAGDPDVPGSKGVLSGDGTLLRLSSSIRNMLSSSIQNGNTTIENLTQLGIKTIDRYGTLKLDETEFNDILKNNPEEVINFFFSQDVEGNDIGFAEGFENYLETFITEESGIISTKNTGIENSIKDLEDRIEAFNKRMEIKEQYYISVFSKLDVALMEAENQMSWMSSQLSSLGGMAPQTNS